jgi:hypothetical protein
MLLTNNPSGRRLQADRPRSRSGPRIGGSIYLHRHGYSIKPVKSYEVKQVVTVRYKHYPEGG